jgi:hypothetical protein
LRYHYLHPHPYHCHTLPCALCTVGSPLGLPAAGCMDIILGAGVSIGGGITTVFRAAANGSVSWQHGNATVGRSPWCKFGAATAGENGRYAVFGGGNGNARRIELYDAGAWGFLSAPSLTRICLCGACLVTKMSKKWLGQLGGAGSSHPTTCRSGGSKSWPR